MQDCQAVFEVHKKFIDKMNELYKLCLTNLTNENNAHLNV